MVFTTIHMALMTAYLYLKCIAIFGLINCFTTSPKCYVPCNVSRLYNHMFSFDIPPKYDLSGYDLNGNEAAPYSLILMLTFSFVLLSHEALQESCCLFMAI